MGCPQLFEAAEDGVGTICYLPKKHVSMLILEEWIGFFMKHWVEAGEDGIETICYLPKTCFIQC